MKSPASSEKAAHHHRKDSMDFICGHGFPGPTQPWFLCSLVFTAAFLFFFVLHSPTPFGVVPQPHLHFDRGGGVEHCDLFAGQWMPDLNGPRYNSSSCPTIPTSKNCFENGRKDSDFVNWRWKPDGCELGRFDPKAFLATARGKKLGFIGDSVARNHMESLLCILSQEEIPRDIYKDAEDRFRTWYFPAHNFTLVTLWSKFLVSGKERLTNGSGSGSFDLYLDNLDPAWTYNVSSLDYAIISNAHWFFRKLYLHNTTGLMGCVYCNEPNVTDLSVGFAVRMAFRAALDHINGCKDCRGMVTLLRTFSPAHFENGTWNTGGNCPRTSPAEVSTGELELELRGIQLEEIERVRKGGEEKKGMRFGAVDVTRAMLMRPDGHPGSHWGNKWMKGFNDCVHWCLPGPIDVWNDFLMAVLDREAWGLSPY